MSREQRAALETAQSRLREVRMALEFSSTPGFVEQRDALLADLAPLRIEARVAEDRRAFLEQSAIAAEHILTSKQLALQGQHARGNVSVFALLLAGLAGFGMLSAAIWAVMNLNDVEVLPLVVIGAVPAFLLGVLLPLRIVRK